MVDIFSLNYDNSNFMHGGFFIFPAGCARPCRADKSLCSCERDTDKEHVNRFFCKRTLVFLLLSTGANYNFYFARGRVTNSAKLLAAAELQTPGGPSETPHVHCVEVGLW